MLKERKLVEILNDVAGKYQLYKDFNISNYYCAYAKCYDSMNMLVDNPSIKTNYSNFEKSCQTIFYNEIRNKELRQINQRFINNKVSN